MSIDVLNGQIRRSWADGSRGAGEPVELPPSEAIFFGQRQIVLPVSDLERSLRIFHQATGLPLKQCGDGWVEVDGGSVRLRLVLTRQPERGAIRLHAPSVSGALGALIAAGATPLHHPRRTSARELVGAVLDPDGHLIQVWRRLTSDECEARVSDSFQGALTSPR